MTGVLGYRNQIYVFSGQKSYIFDGKFSAMYPLGKLVTDNFESTSIWKGFDPLRGQYFTYEDKLYVINKNQVFTSYHVDGKLDKLNHPIEQLSQTNYLKGAPILLPNNRIAVVFQHQVIIIVTQVNANLDSHKNYLIDFTTI